MIALGLLLVAALSVSQYSLSVSRTRTLSKQRTMSMLAAQEAVDSVRSLGFDAILPGTSSRSVLMGRVTLTVATNVVLAQPTMKTVDVAVYSYQGVLLQRFLTSVFDTTP